jgi:hypothetical protein
MHSTVEAGVPPVTLRSTAWSGGIRTSPLWWIPRQRRQATGECVRAFAWWHRCFRRRSHDHERAQTRPLRGLAGPGPFIYALPAGVVTRMNKLLAEGDRDGVVEALFQSVEEISDEDMAALRLGPLNRKLDRIILAVSFVILAAAVVVVLALVRMIHLLRLTLQIVLLRVQK